MTPKSIDSLRAEFRELAGTHEISGMPIELLTWEEIERSFETCLTNKDFSRVKLYRPPKPQAQLIALRDNGWRCHYCLVALSFRHPNLRPTIDHVVPRSKGGTHCLTNKVLACFRCNSRKAD